VSGVGGVALDTSFLRGEISKIDLTGSGELIIYHGFVIFVTSAPRESL
jgi:hypothetical protein